MRALCAPARAGFWPLHWFAAALILTAAVGHGTAAKADDRIVVRLDEATVMQLPERATTIVVGNPIIADIAVQPGNLAVVTGKSYGATNFVVLDRKGVVLSQHNVEVQGSTDRTVVVYRGTDRETYSCTPDCSRRITLGDSPDFFDKTMAETASRSALAQASASLGGGR